MSPEHAEVLAQLASALRARAEMLARWKAISAHRKGRRKRRKKYATVQAKKVYKARRAQKNKELVNEIKRGGCKDCGAYLEGHMSFDHLPEFEKTFDISSGCSRSQRKLREELAKTEVVCCVCHHRREVGRGRLLGHSCCHPSHRNKTP